MAQASTVSVVDKGWDKALRQLQHGKRQSLRVGIFGASSTVAHPRTGKSVGDIAKTNEYGEGSTPSRSMIRTWVDTNVKKMQGDLIHAYGRVIKAHMSPAVEKAELTRLGKRYVAQVQARIERMRIPPKNHPMTIRRKGFDHPLIETRQLIESFRFEVKT